MYFSGSLNDSIQEYNLVWIIKKQLVVPSLDKNKKSGSCHVRKRYVSGSGSASYFLHEPCHIFSVIN